MDTESDIDDMMMTQKMDSPRKVEDLIYDLEVKKMNFINEFNYLEADKIQCRIESLQKSKGSKDKKEIEILHFNELRSLEEKFTAEMESVVQEFNKRNQELEKVSKAWDEELEKKIKQEISDLTKAITELSLNFLRSNKEYMSYVKQEELLVKGLKFKEAHIIKVKREKLMKKNEEESKKLEQTSTPLQKNRYQFDKLHKKHQHEKDMLKLKIGRESEKIKKEKTMTLEQLHHKFKNRKINLENNYKKEISIFSNPVRAKSSSYKIPKLRNNSSVFAKFSVIENYAVHMTAHSKTNSSNKNTPFQPEKINVNLNNIPNQISLKSKNSENSNAIIEKNELDINNDEQLKEENLIDNGDASKIETKNIVNDEENANKKIEIIKDEKPQALELVEKN